MKPIQPLEIDEQKVLRFVPNKIVQYLLENGSIDMNQIACKGFSQEDEEQFAQLIGYSLSGFGELSYVSDATYETAHNMYHDKLSEMEAENKHLRETLNKVRVGIKMIVPDLFRIHEEDLTT